MVISQGGVFVPPLGCWRAVETVGLSLRGKSITISLSHRALLGSKPWRHQVG